MSLGGASELAVDAEALTFYYGSGKKKHVLNDLNISVQRGVIYGLLGPSGCGKTTLLRCIVGRCKPRQGSIRIFGRIPGQRGFSIPGPGIGYMPQEIALSPYMTIQETLMFFGRLCQMRSEEIQKRIKFLMNFLDLPDKKKLVKNISGGQQRRVSFATALLHKAPFIILDEPTVGVDPVLRKEIWNFLENLAKNDHTTIMVTTHYIDEARQANVVGFMRDGHILAQAGPEALMAKYQAPTLEDVFLQLCIKADESARGCGTSKHDEDEEAEPRAGDWDPKVVYSKKTDSALYIKDKEKKKKDNTPETDRLKSSIEDDDGDLHISRLTTVRHAFMRTSALMTKHFLRFKRNLLLPLSQLCIPVFSVVIYCLCIGPKPGNLSFAVVNMEKGPNNGGDSFLQLIDNTSIHQKKFTNLTRAIDSIKAGETWGAIYLDSSFTMSLQDRHEQGDFTLDETIEKSSVRLFLDWTNMQIAYTIVFEIMSSYQTFIEKLMMKYNEENFLATPYILLEDAIYGTRTGFIEFVIPGITMGVLYISSIALSLLIVISEKREGLLERYWMTGANTWEIIFSILLTLFLLMFLQVVLVLVLVLVAFGVECQGSLLWLFIGFLLVGMEGLTFGTLISTICDTEFASIIIGLSSFAFNFSLSGTAWPMEAMPVVIQKFSYYLPHNVLGETIRSIMNRGWDISDNNIWIGYIIASAWIAACTVLSSVIFKYSKH